MRATYQIAQKHLSNITHTTCWQECMFSTKNDDRFWCFPNDNRSKLYKMNFIAIRRQFFLDLINAQLSWWMSISWSSMPSVVADSAKVRSILYLNVNEFFCQLRVTLCMRARVYMCESVGVGLWCRVCVCVCTPVLDSSTKCKALHNFNKLKIFLLWRTFLILFFCGWCCAASLRCWCGCCCVFLFVFIKTLALRIFFFILSFAKEKKHPVVF